MGVSPEVKYGFAPCSVCFADVAPRGGAAGAGAGAGLSAAGREDGCAFSFFDSGRLFAALDQRRSPLAWKSRETSAFSSPQGRAVSAFSERKKSTANQRSATATIPPAATITLRRVFEPERFPRRRKTRVTSAGVSSSGSGELTCFSASTSGSGSASGG